MSRFEEIAKTFNQYFNQFCPAYLENTVPDNAVRPYLTYTLSDTEEFEDDLVQVKIYDNSKSIVNVSKIVNAISENVGYGILIKAERLNVYFRKGSPFAQYFNDDSTELSVYINIVNKIL